MAKVELKQPIVQEISENIKDAQSVVVVDYKEKEKRKERELVNVARDIFGRQTRITYIDLCEQLQQVLDIKERTAKSYIRFMRERNIITKDTANQSCFVIGSYNLRWNTSCP